MGQYESRPTQRDNRRENLFSNGVSVGLIYSKRDCYIKLKLVRHPTGGSFLKINAIDCGRDLLDQVALGFSL